MELNPLVFLNFDRFSGTLCRDISGNNRHFDIPTGVGMNVANILSGLPAYACANQDDNSKITTPHASWQNVTALTVVFTHTINGNPGNGFGLLFSKEDGSGIDYRMVRHDDGRLETYGAGMSTATAPALSFSSGTHVVGWSLSPGGGNQLYIDGVLKANASGTAVPFTPNRPIYIMNLFTGSNFTGRGYYQALAMIPSHLSGADHAALNTKARA